MKIHLTWSAKRAEKDRADRERMLERLRKRLDKPYQLKAAIHEPLVLVQGEYPRCIVTPTRITQTYLDLADVLGLPTLKTNMTLTKFRACTKLDLTVNLKWQEKLESP